MRMKPKTLRWKLMIGYFGIITSLLACVTVGLGTSNVDSGTLQIDNGAATLGDRRSGRDFKDANSILEFTLDPSVGRSQTFLESDRRFPAEHFAQSPIVAVSSANALRF